MKKILSRAALLSEKAVLLYLALAKFILHLLFNGRHGYFRDELYYIICGDRLAFGYVDMPPFTPLMARLLFGDSLLGLRILPALAGAVTVVLAGLIVRKLGGGRFSQALTVLSVIVSGVILNFSVMLTNNGFDYLFWTLAAYLLILIIKDNRPRLWLGLYCTFRFFPFFAGKNLLPFAHLSGNSGRRSSGPRAGLAENALELD